ncbi:transposase-like protein [Paraburkholderia youngii]
MKKRKSLYHGHRFPAIVISCAVRWYFRFSLSLRDIEELLLERGVVVRYETIRCWCDKFGAEFAQRAKTARRKRGNTWHLDESVSRTHAKACGAVRKMGVGLPESACRNRLQTARCCCVQKARW